MISVISRDSKKGNKAPINPAIIYVILVAITPNTNSKSLFDLSLEE